ncbi:MAG: TetR family transcriptional regulator [Desulfobacteraceae bacterium]|nr:TetR family transcriptional regulator [Desulfobacteraceae bacterium]
MARKKKDEAEKTRQDILDAALTVFSQKGYLRSTLNDIATAAGVTRGAIYWHFKDKVDLLEALSDDIGCCHDTTHEEIIAREPFDSLEELRDKILHWLVDIENNHRLNTYYKFIYYKIEYHEELEPVLARQREEKRLILKAFEKDFKQLQRIGQVKRDIKPAHAALMTSVFVKGLIQHWLFDRTAFSMKQTAPVLFNHFIEGLRPQ